MHGPAAMVLATTRIAQKRSACQALTHMRAHSRGLVRDATLKAQWLWGLGCKRRAGERGSRRASGAFERTPPHPATRAAPPPGILR
eukprot:5142834-Prymnesium_polylepis.1